MEADILQAIRIIDDKIASLQEARDRLASAFGVNGVSNAEALYAPKPSVSRTTRSSEGTISTSTPISVPPAQNGTHAPRGRKEELAEFLLAKGPMSRVDIVEKAGLPEGTVSYCLGDKRFFEQLKNGDWDITEFSKRGLERKGKLGNAIQEQG
jgi:hypothetical protein